MTACNCFPQEPLQLEWPQQWLQQFLSEPWPLLLPVEPSRWISSLSSRWVALWFLACIWVFQQHLRKRVGGRMVFGMVGAPEAVSELLGGFVTLSWIGEFPKAVGDWRGINESWIYLTPLGLTSLGCLTDYLPCNCLYAYESSKCIQEDTLGSSGVGIPICRWLPSDASHVYASVGCLQAEMVGLNGVHADCYWNLCVGAPIGKICIPVN